MAVLSTQGLIDKAGVTQPDNSAQQIKAVDTRGMDQDLAASSYNKISDKQLVNLRVYTEGREYEAGEAAIFDNGSGPQTWLSNKTTQGVFKLGDWDLVGGSSGGDSLSLGTSSNGLTLAGANPQILNLQLGTSTINGAISFVDWLRFNGKQDALGFSPEDESKKGFANGYTPLNSSAKIDFVYLPDAVVGALNYKGTWNAATNTPALSDATGTQGDYYVVDVAGTFDLGGGSEFYNVGDWVIHNGSVYDHLNNSAPGVQSVQGLTGSTIDLGSGSEGKITTWGANNLFTETNIFAKGNKLGVGVDPAAGTILLQIDNNNTGINYIESGDKSLEHIVDGISLMTLRKTAGVDDHIAEIPFGSYFGEDNKGEAHINLAAALADTAQLLFDTTGGMSGTIQNGSLWADATGLFYRNNGVSFNLLTSGGGGSGNGDMLKTTYDINNLGIVDDSQKVNGLTVETAVPQGATFTDTQIDAQAGAGISIDKTNPMSPVISSNLTEGLFTSLISGGIVTVNASDPALVDISAGTGRVVLFTDGIPSTITEVSWSELIGEAMPDISGDAFTRLYFDASGTLQKDANEFFGPDIRRTHIALAYVVHTGPTVEDITYTYAANNNSLHACMDYFNANGGVITGSNITTPNANLTFKQSAGTFTLPFIAEPGSLVPSTINNDEVDPKPFAYEYRDGSGGYVNEAERNTIDPTLYDDGSGTLQPVGGTNPDFTWSPVFYFGNFNRLLIIRPQFRYNSKELAFRGISEDFEEMEINPAVVTGGRLIGYFVLDENATDLTDSALAEYVSVRGLASGGGTVGATSFDALTDTPATKAGSAFKSARVNSAENGIEYIGSGDVSSISEFIAAIKDNSIGTINIKRPFTLSGPISLEVGAIPKTIIGSQLNIDTCNITGGPSQISFKNTVYSNANATITTDTTSTWRFTKYDSLDTQVTVTFDSNLTVIYENLTRGANESEAIILTGGSSITREYWNNSGFEVLTANVKNIEELNAAMITRNIGIINIQVPIVFAGTINSESNSEQIIKGAELRFAAGAVWNISGDNLLYIESDVVVGTSSSVTINKTDQALFLSTVYGAGNGDGGNAYDGNDGGTIIAGGNSIIYQTLIDGAEISGPKTRLMWNNATTASTHFINSEEEFIEALNSPYAKTLTIERPIFVSDTLGVTITVPKIVNGAAITFENVSPKTLTIDGQDREIRFYCDIITKNGNHSIVSLQGCKIYIRNLRNEGTETLTAVTPGDIVFEFAENEVSGNSNIRNLWDNTSGHKVKDFTDSFTIPTGTNNTTLTLTNSIDKNVTIEANSFLNVGDGCELSSLLGDGYIIVVAGTNVELIDPDFVSIEELNVKGLRRMNDVGGLVQIQVY